MSIAPDLADPTAKHLKFIADPLEAPLRAIRVLESVQTQPDRSLIEFFWVLPRCGHEPHPSVDSNPPPHPGRPTSNRGIPDMRGHCRITNRTLRRSPEHDRARGPDGPRAPPHSRRRAPSTRTRGPVGGGSSLLRGLGGRSYGRDLVEGDARRDGRVERLDGG